MTSNPSKTNYYNVWCSHFLLELKTKELDVPDNSTKIMAGKMHIIMIKITRLKIKLNHTKGYEQNPSGLTQPATNLSAYNYSLWYIDSYINFLPKSRLNPQISLVIHYTKVIPKWNWLKSSDQKNWLKSNKFPTSLAWW